MRILFPLQQQCILLVIQCWLGYNVTTLDNVDNAILTLIDNATNSSSERIQLRRPLSTVVSPSEVPANVNGDEDDDGSSWQETHMVLMMVISFCSKQLKIHFHRFLIYPRHPTWSLMIVILWCLLSPLYARNGIEHRPGGSDHQTHHQEPGIVGVVHIEHGAWRLWVKSPIFSTFSFLAVQDSSIGDIVSQ